MTEPRVVLAFIAGCMATVAAGVVGVTLLYLRDRKQG